MGTINTTIRDIFILSVILLLVGYYVGASQLLTGFFSGVNTLLLTSTGRNAQGQFANYAGNAPAAGH